MGRVEKVGEMEEMGEGNKSSRVATYIDKSETTILLFFYLRINKYVSKK